jgi:hypothetical protein
MFTSMPDAASALVKSSVPPGEPFGQTDVSILTAKAMINTATTHRILFSVVCISS